MPRKSGEPDDRTAEKGHDGPTVRAGWRRQADIDAIFEAKAGTGIRSQSSACTAGDGSCRPLLPAACREVTAETLAGKEIGALTQVDPAGIFAGKVSLKKLQPIRYRAQRGRRMGGDRPLFLRPGARPDGRLLYRRRLASRLFDKLGRTSDDARGHRRLRTSPSGRPMPSASPSSATSTTGTAAATRCAAPRHGHLGNLPPGITTGHAYKYEIVGQNGEVLPLKADPFARRSELRPRNASMTTIPIDQFLGPTRRIWRTGRARIGAASRSRSTKCMPVPGSAGPTATSSAGTSWPTS
jgi:1,4-alpha-glucan branching enzyme